MGTKTTGTTKKFSVKYIRGLVCPGHLKQKYECVQPDIHLYVSVNKGGTKTFVFRRKMSGSWRTLDLHCKFDESLDDALIRPTMKAAEAKAAALAASCNSGTNPFEDRKNANAEPTLQELFDAYLERHIKKNGRRVDDTIKNFERWFDKLAKRKAASITRHDAEKFHGLVSTERGRYAANRAIQMGRAIYNKAKESHLYFGDNPFSGITLFDEESRERFLSADEAAKLIQALQDVPANHCDYRTLRDFILLDLFTGVRKSNLLSMEWSEIDLQAATWTIPSEKAKNKRAQAIPLGVNELTLLNDRKQILKDAGIISRFAFPGTGDAGHMMDIKRSWTTLRKRVGIEDVTIHDLRRSLAAAMASANVNVALIKGALNHKDMKTTMNVYARTNKQAELEARQLAHAVWFQAVEKLPEADNVKPLQSARPSGSVKGSTNRA